MNNVTPIPVRLEAFEGPLDLLLHLIDKNKINIYDIPVSEITDQYLDYVQQMKEEKLEVASEFLVMAATLLDIKSRMLLPREEKEDEEEEGDPREELVQRLLDYKLTKYQSEELKDKSLEASRNVFREQDLPREVRDYQPPVDYDELLGDTTLKNLTRIFEDVLKRQKNRMDPVRSTFGRIRKEEVSIEERTEQLLEYFKSHSGTSFRALLEGQRTRQSLIVTFLVLLDFIKSGIVHIRQNDTFGEIEIFAGALPAGGMGPQETMPSNKAEARALRKAQRQKEKLEAAKTAAESSDEESRPQNPETESFSVSGGKTVPETASAYKPRVVLSQPGQGRGQDQLRDTEVYIVTRVSEKSSEEDSLNIEETPSEKADEEKETFAENRAEESGKQCPEEEETGSAAETDVYEDAPEEDGESAETEESDVYRLIRSKDWETVLDEYMEDEGLAELLEEESRSTEDAPAADPSSEEQAAWEEEDSSWPEKETSEKIYAPEEISASQEEEGTGKAAEDTSETEEEDLPLSDNGEEKEEAQSTEDAPAEGLTFGEQSPEEQEDPFCGKKETSEEIYAPEETAASAEKEGTGKAVEDLAESEEMPAGEASDRKLSLPEPEEILDRELFEEQDTAVEASACREAPDAPEESETEEDGRDREEMLETALPAEKPESQTEDLSEGTAEEEWKKVRYLQPSRLYFSPWAARWRSPRSRRPSRSRNRMPGRQGKRSGRSLVMRAAACRSIATTAPYSSLPERNTMNI